MGGGKEPVNTFSFNIQCDTESLECEKYGHLIKWYIGMVKFSAALGGFLWIEKSDAY